MKRDISQELNAWKKEKKRKVLLIRGARQVGKTYSIRELGKAFDNFVEVNLDEDKDIHVFFDGSLNPEQLCRKLSAYYTAPISPGKTLLFFDEIQACPAAISALRFFHEKMPDLHVIAAGSLLEFVLSEIPSYGVGRISSMFMYPMTFSEYLMAIGGESLLSVIDEGSPDQPLDEPFHRRLISHLKDYQLIGGMPEVVQTWIDKHDLNVCFSHTDDLVTTIRDDFAKYKKRSPVAMLAEVFASVARQAGHKFKFSEVSSTSKPAAMRDALYLLAHAGLVHLVPHTHARGLPLGAQEDRKRFKAILFDIGIHQRLLGVNVPAFMTADEMDLVNKGSVAEVFAGLEILANQSPHMRPSLHYWHRESRGSNAEVDYVLQQGNAIVPVEVKAGTKGQMQSMRMFMRERGLSVGIRSSLENFGRHEDILTVPLYAIGRKLRFSEILLV